MVPLAIGNATGVKVGFANGARDYKKLKYYAYTALLMSTIFMSLSAVIVALAPGIITSLFTSDRELIKICVPIIYILCFFQVFDGLQATFAGIFRGLKHTEVIMIGNLIAFWLVALPLGYFLALNCSLNLIGFWYALILAGVILCLIMYFNFLLKLRKMEI